MIEINLEESKKILFKILQAVDDCCRKNNIQYSLTYGTLIGAVRHKGFIPWDDDIDLMMTRDNYERFLSLFDGGQDYNVMTLSPDSDWWPCVTRICAKNTQVFFNGSNKSEHGLWVAILPVDNVPDDCIERDKYRYKIKHCFDVLIFKKRMLDHSPIKYRDIIKSFVRFLISPINMYKVGLHAEKIKSKYRNCKTNKVSMWNEYARHTIFPAFFVENYIELEFEGQKYMCVKEYDAFLKLVYGNYMQFPPENERIPLHNYKSYYV